MTGRRLYIGLARIIVVSVVVLAVGPYVIVRGSHLIFGSAVEYEGWRVTVPERFLEYSHKPGLTLIRPENQIFRSTEPGAYITIEKVPSTNVFVYQDHYQKWRQLEVGADEKRGYVLLDEKTVTGGNKKGYCMEFVQSADQSKRLIDCMVDQSAIFCDYVGPESFTSDFYTMFQAMTQIKP